jgi:tetratricopeptide (TPR) repeat protein
LSYRSIRILHPGVTLVALIFSAYQVPNVASAQAVAAQAAYAQALDLLRNGKNADALAVINAAIDAGARDPSLYNVKGLAASELGRDQEAEESFRTLTRLAPRSAMGYNNLGVLFSKLGRNEEAATAFREARVQEPENFTALLGLGTSLVKLNKYVEAATYLQRAWNIRSGDFQVGYEWALALREAKQAAAAKKVLSQLSAPQDSELAVKYYSLAGVVAEDLNDAAAASESYRRAFTLNPNSYEIYLALVRTTLSAGSTPTQRVLPSPPQHLSPEQNLAVGLLFVSHGLYEEAIPRFEETVRQDPSSEAAILNLAQAYSNAGKSSVAMDLIRRSLERQPSAELYHVLANLDEESGQYVEAAQSYQHAVELDPTNEQYYFDLGMEYLAHFTFGPALEVYRVGTQKFPDSSRQYLGLAYSHYAVREYKEAADAFTKALEIDPGSLAVFQAWNTVLSFLAPQDWEALLPRLSRLAAEHSQSAELAFSYGAAFFHSELAKGEKAALDRPRTFLEKAVRLRPNFAAAHLELGSLYAARKQNQKAVDQYLQAIRDDPKSDVAHYRLGQVYRQMNKLELATQELARYQELARLHEDELKHSRSAIQQFVLSPPAKVPAKANDEELSHK